ncbi:Putative YBR222Cp-like protein (Fragment) [Rhizopus microsporus]
MTSDTLYSIFEQRKDARKPAIIIPKSAPIPTTITYHQLLDIIHDFSNKLSNLVPASYLEPGRSISISYPNSLEFVVAFLGSTFMNLMASPLNPAYTEDEFNFYLEDAKSSVLVLPKGALNQEKNPAILAAKKQDVFVVEMHWNGSQMEINAHAPSEFSQQPHRQIHSFNPKPDEPALLLHTSGTTGRPKGVPLTHLNLVTSMRNITNTYELNTQDRTLLVMPLFHVHGLICGLLSTLLSGGTAVIPQRFSASHFWPDFKDNHCNWYTAVPTIHQILLRNPPKEVPLIRFIRSCSSSLAPSTLEALEKHFKAPVLEAYAMTEASHQMTSNPLPHRGPHKPGSVGLGQGVEVVILDEQGNPAELGEVCIRGKNVTKGYLNNPEATASSFTKDGYFRTGDQGKKDKDGYLILTGRIKELINRGGEKISPIELDGVLLSHPKVAEAVSFGVPDEMYGQEVHATVVLKAGVKDDEKSIERELQAYCQSKLAKFKVPKRIYVTDIMPKTATGKIQRRKMVDVFFKGPVKPQARL